MQDDRTMDAFDVIVAELFGDAVDSREVWDVISKQNDASEVHVPGNIKTKKQMQREKRQAQVGLASNVVGMTAGGAALMAAGKDPRLEHAGRLGAAIQKPYKLVSRTKVGSKWAEVAGRPKVAGGLALGAVTLQAANTAGDLVANRVLNREAKKEVRKALDDILDARRKGRIGTDDAIRLAGSLVEGVSKASSPDADDIHAAAEAIVPLIPSKKLQLANSGYQQAKKVGDTTRKARKMLRPKQEQIADEITKSAKKEAGRIALVGLKAMGDEAQGVARAGVKQAGAEAQKTIRVAGEESRKLPKSVNDTVDEGRKLVSDVRSGVNEARDAVKGASASVSEAAGKVGDQIKSAGDHIYRRGRRLALIGAGGVAGAATVPVGVAQLGANHRAKKYGVPIARKPVKKNADPEITWSGDIAKMDTSKRQVFGFALVTHIDGEPVVDLQGDYTPLEEIEKAAYTYVIESRKGGDMHARDGDQPLHTSDLVESFVITPEKLTQMGLEENALPHGWWVGFKVNDDKQWEDVKTGKRTGFSIHGSGRRVEKSMVSKAARDEAAIAGTAAGGAGLAALAAPRWEHLPADKGASERIAAGEGKAATADLRAVARGGGKRAGDKRHVARIAASMADEGFDPKQPIVVHRYKNGETMVRNGHHRLAAAEKAGLKDVPVQVIDDPKPEPRTLVTRATRKLVLRHVKKERQPNPAVPVDQIKAEAAKPEGKIAHVINRTVSRADDVLRDISPKTALKIARKTA